MTWDVDGGGRSGMTERVKVGEWREEDGKMEGRWKMTEEVTDCNSYEALRLQFSCDNVNMGNGTGWGGKRYCMGAPYNTDDGLRSIAYGLIFFNEKIHSPRGAQLLESPS